ncbi:MAG: hypothetical protein AB1449_01820 [Chloroflexota bacterium]
MVDRQFRLPRDIPLEEYPSPETFLHEARRLIDEAQKQGLILRVMGPIALHFYFPEHIELYQRMDRLAERVFTDIDFAAYGKQRNKMVPFFESQGYQVEKRALLLSGGERHIYFSERIPMIDVFFDRLNYNHPIDYRGRLDFHPYCVSLADLLLQKLQIVRISDKDLKDAALLLLAATLGEEERHVVNVSYLARLLGDDWGFCYTATQNLEKVCLAAEALAVLSAEQQAAVRQRAQALLRTIEAGPKTKRWQQRARAGTSKPWYNEVSDW